VLIDEPDGGNAGRRARRDQAPAIIAAIGAVITAGIPRFVGRSPQHARQRRGKRKSCARVARRISLRRTIRRPACIYKQGSRDDAGRVLFVVAMLHAGSSACSACSTSQGEVLMVGGLFGLYLVLHEGDNITWALRRRDDAARCWHM